MERFFFMKKEGLTKRERLHRDNDFRKVFKDGERYEGKNLVLYGLKDVGGGRVGFIAGKRVGGSVVRNKARRWLREIYRRRKSLLIEGTDLIIIAKAGIFQSTFSMVEEEMLQLFNRAGILKER